MINLQTIEITPEILSIIADIDEFKGAWQLLGQLTPERLQVLRKIATIESIGSSTRIEGSKLSDREVEELLSRLNIDSFRSRDEQEVAGYAFVCEEVFDSYGSIFINENTIKQFHGWLLKFSDKDQRHKGEYKTSSNHVEAFNENGKSLGIVFETASPFDTPFKMQELIHWLKETSESKNLHPLLVIAIFIVVFLAIHPFQDGNGRLSRILTTLLLLKSGYGYVPYSSLESIVEDNKESYYLALRRTQQTIKNDKPNWTPWLVFFLRSLQKQKRLLENKMAKEKILSPGLHPLDSEIITLTQNHGQVTLDEIVKATNANRHTIKKHLQNLVATKKLLQHGKGRSTRYTLFLPTT